MLLISSLQLTALRNTPVATAKTGRTTRVIIKKAGFEGSHAGSPIQALHRRRLIEIRRDNRGKHAYRRTTYGDAIVHHNRNVR